MNATHHRRALLVWALWGWALWALIGSVACRRGAGPAPASPPARSYTVRGVIEALPDLARGRPDVLIRHEAIPDFVDSEGTPSPMDGMTMPFPTGEGLSLAGFRAGQDVEMTLRVDWGSRRPFEITALRAVP